MLKHLILIVSICSNLAGQCNYVEMDSKLDYKVFNNKLVYSLTITNYNNYPIYILATNFMIDYDFEMLKFERFGHNLYSYYFIGSIFLNLTESKNNLNYNYYFTVKQGLSEVGFVYDKLNTFEILKISPKKQCQLKFVFRDADVFKRLDKNKITDAILRLSCSYKKIENDKVLSRFVKSYKNKTYVIESNYIDISKQTSRSNKIYGINDNLLEKGYEQYLFSKEIRDYFCNILWFKSF